MFPRIQTPKNTARRKHVCKMRNRSRQHAVPNWRRRQKSIPRKRARESAHANCTRVCISPLLYSFSRSLSLRRTTHFMQQLPRDVIREHGKPKQSFSLASLLFPFGWVFRYGRTGRPAPVGTCLGPAVRCVSMRSKRISPFAVSTATVTVNEF